MPLLWLSLAFLVGIVLGAQLNWPTSTWLYLVGANLVIWLLLGFLKLSGYLHATARVDKIANACYPRIGSLKPPLPLALLLFVILTGAYRFQSVQPVIEPNFIAWYNDLDGEVTVEGMLVQPADVRDTYINLKVKVDSLQFAEHLPFSPVHGLILAKVPPGEVYRYGDRLRLHGRLETPPESEQFSYRDYLVLEGVYSFMGRAYATPLKINQGNPLLKATYALKEKSMGIVYQIYPDPEASLLAGILLGVDKGIPEGVQEDFKKTGTAHIIAISGFNNPLTQTVLPQNHQERLEPQLVFLH
jgi:competence protein ComEC